MKSSNRLARLTAILALAATFSAVPAHSQTSSPAPVIATDAGKLDGIMTNTGVRAYLGIPYAAPPVRDLRWRDPRPVTHWRGIYHADRFGPQCMQPQRNLMANQYSGAEKTSEDCLYLNVWAKPGATNAPVIVFIHGGAFFIGSGSMPLYSGEDIAAHGAVFVNLNYRLGALGFMALPELSKESPHVTSGNYGFLDQIAALRWVKRNIAQFGGDPRNVTIMGQSAGSMSVLVLQSSPLAKGLFQRTVGMSGAMIGSAGPATMSTLSEAEQNGQKLEQIWHANNLSELRALPADRLGVPRALGSPPVGPNLDGYVLPSTIEDIFAHSAQSDVPLLVGFTHDESFGGLGKVTGLADYKRRAKEHFGSRAATFLKLYPAQDDEQARLQAHQADRDATMTAAMDAWARAQAEHGQAPVYSYMFARPHSYAKGVTFSDLDPATAGSYHTSGVPFWLGTLDSFNEFRHTRDWTPADRHFSSVMMDALVQFARTGSPSTSALKWPRFEPGEHEALMELGSTAHAGQWPDERKLQFFRGDPK